MGIYFNDCLHDSKQAYEALRKSLKWGSWEKNKFSMRLTPDFNIILKLKEYTEKLETVSLTDKRERQPDDALPQHELQQFRAVAGRGQWLATETQLDLAVRVIHARMCSD